MTKKRDFPNLVILDHPLIQHKLAWMRKRDTPTAMFRGLLKEISILIGYEITREVPLRAERVETPLAETTVHVLAGRKPVLLSVLRAGLGMAEGLRELMPSAREGHIGLYRDPETKQPVEYYVKMPEPGGRLFIVCDPMLATGNSAAHAVDVLKANGVEGQNIRFMALLACPEGASVMLERHPDVKIYAASLDDHLNENAYVVPGLGDAGDRLFGTR